MQKNFTLSVLNIIQPNLRITKSCPHFFILKRDLIKCYNLIECVSK